MPRFPLSSSSCRAGGISDHEVLLNVGGEPLTLAPVRRSYIFCL